MSAERMEDGTMSLTPEQLAHIRATALAAVDGWSPTSSSFAALEHCAASHPQAVVALCDRVLGLEATVSWHMSAHKATCLERDTAHTLLGLERAQTAKLLEGLRALEAERDGMAKALELARDEIARLREACDSWHAAYTQLSQETTT